MKKLILLALLVGVVSAGPHYKEKYTTPLNETVISNFDDNAGTGWTLDAGDSIRDDYTNVKAGTKSIKMYNHGVSSVGMRSAIFAAKDLSSYDYVIFRYYLPNRYKAHLDSLSSSAGVELKIASASNLTAYWNLLIPMGVSSPDGWYEFCVDKKNFVPLGTPNWSSIVRVRIVFYSRDAVPVELTCDKLSVGNTPVAKGGIIFSIDNYLKTINTQVFDIFNRYGMTVTLFYHGISKIMDGNVPTGSDLSIDDLHALQNGGWDISARGYYSPDTLTKLNIDTVDAQLFRTKNMLSENGFRGSDLYAYPWGYHNRIVDSVAARYFSFVRAIGAGTLTTPTGGSKNSILSMPVSTLRYTMPTFAFNGNTLADLTSIVDSTITNKWVSPILIHNFSSTSSGGQIDTNVLKTFLQYTKNKVDSGYLSEESGRFSNYFVYAPDSCIIHKTTTSTATSYTTNDSLASFVDSCKVFLYENGTLVDSTGMMMGDSAFSMTRTGLTSNTTYSYQLRARNASGEWDSSYSVRSIKTGCKYTIAGHSIATVDTVWKSMASALGNGSTYTNRAVGGTTWQYWGDDLASSTVSRVEGFTTADTSKIVLFELGTNNLWTIDGWATSPNYITPSQELEYINLIYNNITALGKSMILGEILPTYPSYETNDSIANFYLDDIDAKNALRKKWCAYHNVPLAMINAPFRAAGSRHPSALLFNADLIHPNTEGSILLGQLYAAATVPTVTNTYAKNTQKINLNNRAINTSSTSRLHSIDLKFITDAKFWNNLNPDGSNLSVYVNGVKTKRIVEKFCPYARRGIILFPSVKVTELQVKANYDLTETNDTSIYSATKIIRRYPLQEAVSGVKTFVDAYTGKNTTSTTATGMPYYPGYGNFNFAGRTGSVVSPAMWLDGNRTGSFLSSTPEFSGKSKFTISYWMYIPPANTYNFWAANSFLFVSGNSDVNCFRLVFNSTHLTILCSNGGTAYWQITKANLTPSLTDAAWHKMVLSFDLPQSTSIAKFKLVVDSTDLSSLCVASGTMPTALPTITDQFSLFGRGYSAVTGIPLAAFDDVQIIDDALTVPEIIDLYKEQKAVMSAVSVGSGGGNSNNSFRGGQFKGKWQVFKSTFR